MAGREEWFFNREYTDKYESHYERGGISVPKYGKRRYSPVSIICRLRFTVLMRWPLLPPSLIITIRHSWYARSRVLENTALSLAWWTRIPQGTLPAGAAEIRPETLLWYPQILYAWKAENSHWRGAAWQGVHHQMEDYRSSQMVSRRDLHNSIFVFIWFIFYITFNII